MSVEKIITVSKNLAINISSDSLERAKVILGEKKYHDIFIGNYPALPTIEEVRDEAAGNSPDAISRYEEYLMQHGNNPLTDTRSNLRDALAHELRSGVNVYSQKEIDAGPKWGEEALFSFIFSFLSAEEFEALKKAEVLITSAHFDNVLEEFSPKNQLAARDLSQIDEIIIGCWRSPSVPALKAKIIESGRDHIILPFSKSCCYEQHTESHKLILGIKDERGGLDITEFNALKVEDLVVLANALGHKVKKFSDHTGMLYASSELNIDPRLKTVFEYIIENIVESGKNGFSACLYDGYYAGIYHGPSEVNIVDTEWYKVNYPAIGEGLAVSD